MEEKQRQFDVAMAAYQSRPVYHWIERAVSLTNVSFQLYFLLWAFSLSIGAAWHALAFVAAFVAADFVNGLVHMIMDSSDRYASFVGPLIANFHLHHRTPVYRQNRLHVVYFNESGSKIWLVFFFLLIILVNAAWALPPILVATLAYFGFLSSVAEVSHYLCHAPDRGVSSILRKTGLLLSRRHHAKHHATDNRNYAFLNGMTDPVLNLIAALFFSGYKNGTDLHYGYYQGADSENRR